MTQAKVQVLKSHIIKESKPKYNALLEAYNEFEEKEKIIFQKSNSFSDFQVNNLNKSSKKIDFSIVEQRVDPIEIFTNLSECDLRDVPSQTQNYRFTQSNAERTQSR